MEPSRLNDLGNVICEGQVGFLRTSLSRVDFFRSYIGVTWACFLRTSLSRVDFLGVT